MEILILSILAALLGWVAYDTFIQTCKNKDDDDYTGYSGC